MRIWIGDMLPASRHINYRIEIFLTTLPTFTM